MSQLPITGNAVNNGCPRDPSDIYVNAWFYDPDTRFMHLGFQGFVGRECAPLIERLCEDIEFLLDGDLLHPDNEASTGILKLLSIVAPIAHHCANARLVAFNYNRSASHQTQWQDRALEPHIPSALPTWENDPGTALGDAQTQSFTVLYMLDTNSGLGFGQ